MKIRLTPCGSDFTKVQMRIDGIYHDFFLSGVMGSQFSSFLTAVYCLYEEDDFAHYCYHRRTPEIKREYHYGDKNEDYITKVEIHWDGEKYGCSTIILQRENHTPNFPAPNEPDPIRISFCGRRCKAYTVDGRDFCYAIAKACTEALKKYGFKGYLKSNSGYYLGDSISIEELLFIKAYALGVLSVRQTTKLWEQPTGWMSAVSSSFEKEMELLLFDM